MTIKLNKCTGTNGTTVSTGNSADPDAWALVSLNSQTCVYDTSVSMHNGSSIRMDSQTAASTLQVGWTDTASTSFAVRWYERFSAWPSASQQHGMNVRGSSGATSLARTEVDTTGHIRIVMSGTSSFSTTVLTTGSWFRFEMEGTAFNGSAGTLTLRIYSGDSTTPLETLSLSSQTSSATIDTIRFGKFNGVGTVTSYFDSIAANIGSSTPLGPYALTVNATDSVGVIEGTTNIAPASAGDNFTLSEGTSSYTAAVATGDNWVMTDISTDTTITSTTDSATLSDVSALTVNLARTDSLKQGDSPQDSVRLANQIVSWGGGLDASYIVAAASDTSDMTVGDKCVLYDSNGVPKENTLFEVTVIGAPFSGFQNVSIYPSAAITPVSGDVLAKVVPAGAAVQKNTDANDSAVQTEGTTGLSDLKTATDSITLTDSSVLDTGQVNQNASDSFTLAEVSALTQGYATSDSAAVSDVSVLSGLLDRSDALSMAEGTTGLSALLSTGDSVTLAESVAIQATTPGGSLTTYRGYTTETPPTAGNSDSDVWLAVEFYVTQDCQLTAGYYWQPATNTNTNTRWGWLFQGDGSSGTAIAETDHVAPTGSGWQRLPYTTPVNLTANTRYRMAVFFQNGGYPATTLFFDTGQPGLSNGPLVVPPKPDAQGNDQNLFVYDSASPPPYPTDSFNSGSYYVDVEVATGSAPAGGVASDSITLSEVSVVSQVIFANDSIALADASSLLSADVITASDTATQTDASQPIAGTIATSDGLTQSEGTTAITANVSTTDSWALSDVSALNAGGNVSASDSGTMSEVSAVTGTTTTSDSITLSESSSLQIFWAAVDSASLSDLSTLGVALAVNDAATQDDSSNLLTGNLITANDSATQSDASQLTTVDALAVQDAATLSESASVTVVLSASDSVLMQEASAGTAPYNSSDTFTMTDSALLSQLFAFSAADGGVLMESSLLTKDDIDDDDFFQMKARFPDLLPHGSITFPEEV